MAELIDYLMKAGFTRHESVLYVALCSEGQLSGYEAAKLTGIQRSNAYLALAGLVEKGAANRIEGSVVKFAPVPGKELAANIKREMARVLQYIEENTPERDTPPEAFITITGSSNIFNKMKNILTEAKERVYLSLSDIELGQVEEELNKAIGKGLKVVIITTPGNSINGAQVYYNEKQPGQIRLIADTSQVLTGDTASGSNSAALFSRNRNLVDLIKDSLTNEIKLIRLREDSQSNK